MANVDLTLRMTNPQIYNNLLSWQQHGMNINVRLNVTPNFNATQLRQQMTQAIGQVNVTINPTLGNVGQLRQQIRQAIGNVSINVSIGNLAALSNQIAQLFAGLGLQLNNNPPPPRSAQAVQRGLAGIYARQLRDDPNGPDTRLQNVPRALTAASTQPGLEGIRNTEAVRRIIRSQAAINRQTAKANAEFREKGLLSIALNGPDQAAREFEEERGLRRGTINTRGVGRFSFDPTRIFRPAAFREVAISGAVGGIGGLVGGAIGASALGSPGVYGGATIGQAVVGSATQSFERLFAALSKAASAGLELEKNILGVSAALTTSSRVTRNGQEVGISESIGFQRKRAEGLLTGTRGKLSQLGINQSQQAALLRGVITGASEGGFNLADKDAIRLTELLGGTTAVANEDLLQNAPRLVNDVSDLLSGAPTAGRSELGQQFRRILPEIKAAQATGDTDKLIAAFEKYRDVIETLKLSTDSAAVAARKYSAITQELETSFGQAFNKAIVPGLNALVDVLSKPEVKDGLVKLGTDIGNFVNIFIESFSGLIGAINPESITRATSAYIDFTDSILNFFPLLKGLVGGYGINLNDQIGTTTPNGAFVSKQIVETQLINDQAEKALNAKRAAKGLGSISTGNGIGTGAFRPDSGLSVESIPNPILALKKQLTNIDTGTPEGAYRAALIQNQLKALGEGNSEGLTADVLSAQSGRLTRDFNLKQQIAGVNSQTAGGGLLGNVLGLQQKVNAGDITGAVGQQQASQAILKATEDLVNSFYSLQKSVQDSALALEQNARIHSELNITLEEQKKQLLEIRGARELEGLQGIDKLYALGDQIREAGGTVPILANNIGGELGQQFSLFNSPEDKQRRQRDILERQFKAEAAKLDTGRFNAQTKLQQSQAFRQAETTFQDLEQTAPDGVRAQLQRSQLNQQILDFAQQFGGSKAQEKFGENSVRDAIKFFGKESDNILNGAAQGNTFEKALKDIFGTGDYFSKMQTANTNAFKAALDGVDS